MRALVRSLLIATSFLTIASTVSAQNAPVRRIGFVAGAGGFEQGMAVTNKAFFDALAEAGFSHGKAMNVVFRTAEGNMTKMPSLVREVLEENVEILVVSSSPGCAAAKEATKTVPILCISVQDDPVKAGLTVSESRGTDNVIGVHSFLNNGISQQLDWLTKFVQPLKNVAILYNPKNATHVRLLSEWERVAKERSIAVVPMSVEKADDIGGAIARVLEQKAQIAIGLLGADTYALRKEIAAASNDKGFPIVMDTPGGYTQMGGLATVGVDIVPYYRRGALEQMVPLLRGTKPSELPWIGPQKVDVRLNGATAKKFNVAIPDGIPVD